MPLTHLLRTSALLLTALLTGCITQLTDDGARVNLVTAPKAASCEVIKPFKFQGSSADDALNTALNEAAKLGGNGLGVESVTDVEGRTEINGVALKCLR